MAANFQLTATLKFVNSNANEVIAKIKSKLKEVKLPIDVKITGTKASTISALAKSIKELKNASSTLKNITSVVNIKMSASTPILINNYTKAFDQLNISLISLLPRLDQAEKAFRDLRQAMLGVNAARVNIGNVAQQVQKVTTPRPSVAPRAGATAGQLSDPAAFGRQAAFAVRRFAAFSLTAGPLLAVTYGMQQAISEAIKFEKELVRITQIAGGTTKDLNGVSEAVTKLSTSLGVSSSELISVANTLSQAEVSIAEIPEALRVLSLTQLAPTFDDINETVDAFIAIRGQFVQAAGDMEGALSSMNAVSAKFAVESADLVTAVQKAGGAFAASGGSLDELFAVFTAVRSQTRESADTVAVGIRTITANLQRLSTSNFLSKFGVQIRDARGEFIGTFDALEKIVNLIQSTGGTKSPLFAQIAGEVAGIRNFSKFAAIVQNFDTAKEALGVSLGGKRSLQDNSLKALQSLDSQIQRTKEQLLALFRTIVDSSTFQLMVRQILALTQALVKFAGVLTNLLPLLGAFAAARVFKAAGPFLKGFFGGGALIQGVGGGGATANLLNNTSLFNRQLPTKTMPQTVNSSMAGMITAGGKKFNSSFTVPVPGNFRSQLGAAAGGGVGVAGNISKLMGDIHGLFIREMSIRGADLSDLNKVAKQGRVIRKAAMQALKAGNLHVQVDSAGNLTGVAGLRPSALVAAGLPGAKRTDWGAIGAGLKGPLAAGGLVGGMFLANHLSSLGVSKGDKVNPLGVGGSALAGALTGGVIGGTVGGPWGAAIGAAIGGLVGFTSALKEAAQNIADFKFGQFVDKLDESVKKFGANSKETKGALRDVLGQSRTQTEAASQHTFLENWLGGLWGQAAISNRKKIDIAAIRDKTAQNVRPTLNRIFGDTLKESKDLPEFQKKLKDLQKELGPNFPEIEKLFKELQVTYEAEFKARKEMIEKFRDQISIIDQVADNLNKSLSNFLDTIFKDQINDRKLQGLHNVFTGSTGGIDFDKTSDLLLRPDSKLFEGAAASSGFFDPIFKDIGFSAKNLLQNILPNVLQNSAPDDFGSATKDLLKQGGVSTEFADQVQKFIDDFVAANEQVDPNELRKSLQGWLDQVGKDILGPAAEMQKQVELAGSKLVSGLEQVTAHIARINQEFDHLGQMRVDLGEITRQVQERQTGREIPFDVNAAANARAGEVNRLVGTNDIGDILRNGMAARDQLQAEIDKNLKPGDKGFKENRENIEGLGRNVNNTVSALQKLADASRVNAGIQQRLAQINKEEAARKSFTSKFFGSDLEGRLGLIQQKQAADIAAANPEDFKNLPAMVQKIAMEGLQSFADLPVFNGKTGDAVLGEITKHTFGLDPKKEDERKNLEAQLIKNQENAIKAQEALIIFLQDNNKVFLEGLKAQFDALMVGLGKTFNIGGAGIPIGNPDAMVGGGGGDLLVASEKFDSSVNALTQGLTSNNETLVTLADSVNRFSMVAPQLSTSMNRWSDVAERFPSEVKIAGDITGSLKLEGDALRQVQGSIARDVSQQIVTMVREQLKANARMPEEDKSRGKGRV